MTAYQRAFRYLWRKKTKAIILFLVLLVVGSMILCSIIILRTTQDAKGSLIEKTKSKVILEITDEKAPITDTDIQKIEKLPNVTSINRMASNYVYPSGFNPVTYKDDSEGKNRQVTVLAYDDTEIDGAFAEQKYRLIEGNPLDASHNQGILINSVLADANSIRLDDRIEFCTADGKKASGIVIGIFQSGNVRQQDDSTLSAYRIENQIFVNHALFAEIFGAMGYSKVSVYAQDPEQLAELENQILGIVGNKAELSGSDTLYKQMKAPLEQVARVTKLVLILTLLTAVVVVTLLLCIWMRARRKENAIFISLGEKKTSIYFQSIIESLTVFITSVGAAIFIGSAAADKLQNLLLDAQQSEIILSTRVLGSDVGMLLIIGSLVILFSVGISLVSTLRANPRDILSNMEG